MLSADKKKMVIKHALEKNGPDAGTVYLVRHGCTEFNSPNNSEDRIRGWLNVPLDRQGKEEADNIGKFLKDKKIDKIYYSDLDRTHETGEIINKYVKSKKMEGTSSFRPWNLGDLQGTSSQKAHSKLEKYIKAGDKAPKGGETWDSFASRFLDKLRDVLNEAAKTGKNIAIISHYRNLKLAQAWGADGMKNNMIKLDKMVHGDLETGAIIKFTENNGKWKLEHIKVN
jgi:broad specificity phosphatase PhoE